MTANKRKKAPLLLIYFFVAGIIAAYFALKSWNMAKEPVVEVQPDNCYEQTLVVATDDCYWPYVFYDKNGRLSGHDIEYIAVLANQMKVNIEIKPMSWEKALAAARRGEADLLLTCEHTQDKTYPADMIQSVPISSGEFVVFGRKDIDSLDELFGKKIALMKNGNVNPYIYELGLKPYCREYESNKEAFAALVNGECDYVVCRYIIGCGILKELGSKAEGIEAQQRVTGSYICIGVLKGNNELAGRLNQAIIALKKDGTTIRLNDKWLTTFVTPYTITKIVDEHPRLVGMLLLMILALVMLYFRHREVKLELAAEKGQYQQVVENLANDFDCVSYVLFHESHDDDTAVLFRVSDTLRRNVPGWESETLFTRRLDMLKDCVVVPEDRDEFYKNTRRDVVISNTRGNQAYYVNFRALIDGVVQHYQIKFNAITDADGKLTGFVSGVHNVESEAKKELVAEAQQKKLEQNFAIIDVLASEYSSVYYIDLKTDGLTPYTMNENTETEFGNIFRSGISYSEAYRLYVDSLVAEEDRTRMLKAGSIANIIKELARKKTFITTYRSADGHYSEMKFVKVGAEADKPLAVALGFADKDEELRAKDEAEKVLKRNIDIIEILASEYSSVYYIDLMTDELDPYTMNAETESEFGKIFRSGIKYSDAFRMYVDTLVYEEDRKLMLEAGSRYNILAELAGKKTFITTYRSDNGGNPHYCEMKFVKVGSEENPQAVALGFADKDEEIRAEMERQRIARRDAAVIAGLSDDFGCVVYVNLDTLEEIHYRFDPLFTKNIPDWEKINNFSERLDKLMETVMHPEDREPFRTASRRKVITEAIDRDDVYYVNFRTLIDGEVTFYQAKFVRDENSDNHIIAGFHNVDETMKRELQYQQQLEAANRSKTDFLFNMSHDIRTPMNAITGFTDLAKKHIDEPEKVTDYLTKISTASYHLLELINEVLDMSRVEAGKLKSEIKMVNIDDATARIMTICHETAEFRQIKLRRILGNIRHRTVLADELHINQIIMNIIGNAIKYTKPGGSVTFGIDEIDSEVPGYGQFVISVSDTGIGMSKEFRARIFDSFAREETETVSGIQGTGLGMSIVKRLVDYMDGRIDIESEQGKGTTVRVTLHLLLTEGTAKLAEQAVTGLVQTNFSGRKVLLVEDNELNREIATELLKDSNFIVEEAVNGKEALEIITEKGPDYYDYVLMDIQMPIMNGYEATRAIRRLHGADRLPIIALSANAFEEDRQKSLKAGMNAHVPKPIDISELVATMAAFAKEGDA